MTQFLTKEDLNELTGTRQIKKQITWLEEKGYRFDIGNDSLPKVLWEQVRERQLKRPAMTTNEPNEAAIYG